jgi:hypothetical protein
MYRTIYGNFSYIRGVGYPLASENRPRNIVFRRFVRIFLFILIYFELFFHTFISLFETNKMYESGFFPYIFLLVSEETNKCMKKNHFHTFNSLILRLIKCMEKSFYIHLIRLEKRLMKCIGKNFYIHLLV